MSKCWLRYDCGGIQFVWPMPQLTPVDVDRIVEFAENRINRQGPVGSGTPAALPDGMGVGIVYEMGILKRCS
jgi:hypothetical protein